MPTFVRMWPLLRPVCSQGFREFVKRRFGLRFDSRSAETPDWHTVRAELVATAEVESVRVQNLRPTTPPRATVPEEGTHELAYRLMLGGDAIGVVLGTARVVEGPKEAALAWTPNSSARGASADSSVTSSPRDTPPDG
jgi:hypothetical protein